MTNIFQYAANEEKYFENQLENMPGGYERKTTFYSDLSIAETFDTESIKNTFEDVCKYWIGDYEYFTEFVLCLNYKSWEWHAKDNKELVKTYSELYYEAMNKFFDYYGESGKNDKEALKYYFSVMD